MNEYKSRSSIAWQEVLSGWAKILSGKLPVLSIEITRECPLNCPGCYAYGDMHLGGENVLRDLRDFRGKALVDGVLGLVRKHRPLHVSLVGGEPLVRHRELSSILPELSAMNIFSLVVTSGVIPIPMEWLGLQRLCLAVSVDGLPEHHDIRRKPATYERILKNIRGRKVNVHWVITRQMLQRAGYLEEYVACWSARPEVQNIWVSLYTPQIGEQSAEILTAEDRRFVARELPRLRKRFPKLQVGERYAETFIAPPVSPADCLFAKMSVNYSADLQTRVEPCVFGGAPDCSQCGCAASSALQMIRAVKIAGPLRIGHLVGASVNLGLLVNRLRGDDFAPSRWDSMGMKTIEPAATKQELVQIERHPRRQFTTR